ncbi:hypothetical protein ND861_17570 [Leptospira sp. 2 VSF19]|uniref:Uncharacterized protein n=1 Tax=Leptospira soteropolitanensis TaxID=2950025 RepID=A0AAW5VTL1_9LEPT|nr:hypothetical protein [Leptospira soteropolitanensis]MCW7494460.1 hypothetical protein [Leptospira soteropolitanensis]MCW7502054.1 hypothetical protein [Leptospira soteropolitanensis]MCW7524306.1 hypothetical protein [Leptospira soteropolitanensis]MCW7528171.1 hypothetical protein [Leptospira soteropolitanensis]MCW7532024.1 hypothetical protein [Leptospira soteropolitanensis]
MTPVSRTEAHRVFADLYRKTRTPEHQQLIDEAILKSNDVFIRIDLIRKVDEDYEAKNKPKKEDSRDRGLPEKEPPRREVISRPTSPEPKPKRSSNLVTIESAKQNPTKKRTIEQRQGGGLLAGLFGGGAGSVNNSISKFGKDTGTIDIGLFGRNPTISNNVEKLFRGMKEDVLIPTIQALRVSEQQGWRIWTPLVYNIINNFNKFYNAFASLDALILDKISADIFLERSLKMQMFYVRFLQRSDANDIILSNLPDIVKMDEKLTPKLGKIMEGVNYALNLENTRPKLSEAITAFYIVAKKKMFTWPEIVSDLRVPAIQEHKFQAAREIQKEVEITVAKISDDINTRTFKKEELQNLRSRYFSIDDKGKISFDFLNAVVDDFMAHHMPESAKSQTVKNSFKSQPHRLVYLLLRDLQTVYINLIEGYVRLGDKNQNQELLIIQPGLFRNEIDQLNSLVRTIDNFNKKFPSFQYSFQQYGMDFSTGNAANDQIAGPIVQALQEASEFFGSFADKLNIIVENHLMAKVTESKGKVNDKIASTKDKVIEEVKIAQRFIPHYDKAVVAKERINGMKVEDVFIQFTKYLYNYAVIFKDQATTSKLTAHRKLEQELIKLNKEYERLTYSSFHKDAGGVSGNAESSENQNDTETMNSSATEGDT